MNELDILNAMYNGVIVKCIFENTERSKLADVKVYSYKCNIPDVKVGDKVIVESPQGYFRSVVVVEVSDSLEMEQGISYKWVVSKLYLDDYEQLMSKEALAIKHIRRTKQNAIRKQMIESAGISADELNNILLIVNGAKL
jgi:hypothetical protein